MTFGEKLQQLRGQAELTQAALAQASGLSLGAIRDYEQGKKEPSLRSAARLAQALEVSVEVFVTDLDAPAVNAKKSGSGKTRSKATAKRMPPPQHKPKVRQARRPRDG